MNNNLLHISQLFKKGIKKKAIILTTNFPYMVIGKLEAVTGEHVSILADISNINEFDRKKMIINLDSIQTFYIEEDGDPKIPKF